MKEKAYIGIVFAALLIVSTFAVLTTKAAFKGTITVGIIGPVGLPHWEPAGMMPAAEMAADEINAAGGVALADGNYQIVLKFGDEHAYPVPPDPAGAASEVERLITVEGCEFLIGGFRTETTSAIIAKAMDYGVPLILNGAATNELISSYVNKTDPTLYSRYKYLFRVNPTNSSTLGQTIIYGIQYLLATKFVKLFGHVMTSPYYSPPIPPGAIPGFPNGLPAINVTTGVQVKVAVITENLAWTAGTHAAFTNPAIYPRLFGPYVNVTYSARITDGETDCSSFLQGVKDSGARIMIHIFSGPTGDPFITQWRSMNVSAIPVGISVFGQTQDHYEKTAGACEYETFTIGCGTRTPLTNTTTTFWDNFVDKTGQWPIYTAFGAYDGVYLLANALKAIGSKDKDQLVTYLEDPAYQTESASGLGHFKFDSTHDVFSNESYGTWKSGFVRTRMAQWQAQRIEIVTPLDAPYTKKFAIPPFMYPLSGKDINYDGTVNILDISGAAKAFGSQAGDTRWDKESDSNFDGKVNILDLSAIAKDFGKSVTLPLP